VGLGQLSVVKLVEDWLKAEALLVFLAGCLDKDKRTLLRLLLCLM
jgi:hypothetical protein